MIAFDEAAKVFRLTTETTSYLFRITEYGHLEHIYYGARIPDGDVESLLLKRTIQAGSSVLYRQEDATYCLDTIPLEWSGIGCGDYRMSPAELKMPDGTFTADFTYEAHAVAAGAVTMETLPGACGGKKDCAALIVTLRDASNDVSLSLYYTVFPETDVIARRVVVENHNAAPLVIRRIMSMQLDLQNRNDTLVTFDGGWIHEARRHDRRVQYGAYVTGSTTGASSNRSNPGFLLAEAGTTEDLGNVYGFNLIYSGNHCGSVERDANDLLRVQLGIHPHCFEWTLRQGERFETPEAVMTFSAQGFNGMSARFHDFINRHVVRGDWQGRERPVLLNNWEAHFFRFTRGKLLRLARGAKKLGAELFVLDDGWFGKRNNDAAGLGDYAVNRKKLPRGIAHFSGQIHALGLKFGLWFEPEMVNRDSDLFRAHPEYALTTPGKQPALGRNQLVLDLCNPAVRDYIVEHVGRILDEAEIDYVKWDMNRHISDARSPLLSNQGEFYHRYILGLYDVLGRIFRPRPQILLESCASGGDRFDLGMLCFSPQVWSSDNTDPIERLSIQQGLSYLYPLSAMGAHVSAAPHQQTLRDTPLSTRFNVAAFGCLGYELDLKHLTPVEKREIRDQIVFYRAHRRTLQYGRFYRAATEKQHQTVWQCVDAKKSAAVAGFFQGQAPAAAGNDTLPLKGLLPEARYTVRTRPQRLILKRFGGLIRHMLPMELNPNGIFMRMANRLFALDDCVETYTASGAQLMQGVRLNTPFIGTGYNAQVRMLGDFGSNLYLVGRTDCRSGAQAQTFTV